MSASFGSSLYAVVRYTLLQIDAQSGYFPVKSYSLLMQYTLLQIDAQSGYFPVKSYSLLMQPEAPEEWARC